MTQPTAQEIEEFIHGSFPTTRSEPHFSVEEAAGDTVRVRYFARPAQLRPGGTISGPAQMAAADLAAWAVVLHRLGLAAAASVTSNFTISFLARPAPGDLVVEATLLKLGKRQAVCSVRISSADSLVAHATVTYAIVMAAP